MGKDGRKPEEAKCCGVVHESLSRSREKREKRKDTPQPWIVLKISILLTLGIIGYAFYVYIGRLCMPMIRHNTGAIPGGKGAGIALLVIFCLLGVMMLWSYAMVVFTSPGKAKDFAEKCQQPPFRDPLPPWSDSDSELNSGPYIPISAEQAARFSEGHDHQHSVDNSTAPSAPSINLSDKHYTQRQDYNAGVTSTLPPVQAAHGARDVDPPRSSGNMPADNAVPMMHTRRPSTTPVLLPEYRYCQKDKFVKPMRTHHCRACGTCILKYDHHCPWIGQCVGAHNHKFFVHFLQWTLVFCLWTLGVMVANVVKSNKEFHHRDPQQIVVIALSALFILFTVALLATHIRMIVMNFTTVEAMNMSHMQEREKVVLSRLHAWWQTGAKRRTRKQWDQEWGRIGSEGNLWWLGSARKNWEAVMGDKVYQWFLPLGRTPGDGLTYPTNPRFDSEGRWRRRSEWPAELR